VRAGVVACSHAWLRRVVHTHRHSRRARTALRAVRVRPRGQPRTRAFRKRMTAQASTPCASVNSTTMKYGLCGKAHKYLKGKRYDQGYFGYSDHRAEPWSTGFGKPRQGRACSSGATLNCLDPSTAGTRSHLRRDSLTSAPGLAHICTATRPHLRRDPATSAPGPSHICAGTRPHRRHLRAGQCRWRCRPAASCAYCPAAPRPVLSVLNVLVGMDLQSSL